MIDWSLVKFPLLHAPIYSGEVVSISSDGVEEWRSPKRMLATGSYEKRLSVKSIGGNGQGMATHLWLNGNPSKFLQGHNVFGSNDLTALLYDVFLIVTAQFGLKPSEEELNRIKTGDYDLLMMDVNFSFDLPSRADVLAFIRAMEFKAKTRHGRPSMKGGTLYFGKTSEYWAIKLYCKAEEIQTKNGKLPMELQGKGIENWAENKLRIELRLLSKELKRLNIIKVNQLTTEITQQIFNDYLQRIDMTQQIKINDDTLLKMPARLRSTYTLWQEGHDLRNLISRTTYHRHRKDLKQYGINIDLRPESIEKSNVVPLVRILEAKPASIPEWAFEQNLVHPSAIYAG